MSLEPRYQIETILTTVLLDGRRLGDHPQVVGDYPTAHPAFHPSSAVIAAPLHLMAPFQAADAPFNPRSPIPPPSEPALLFVSNSFARCSSGLGEHHLLDAMRCGIVLVCGGVDPALPREQAGWTLEDEQMMR